jgi:hypothetical protein
MRQRGRGILMAALVLAWIATGLAVVGALTDPDRSDDATVRLVQLALAVVALACGVAVVVRARRERAESEDEVIDLRERLGGLVDLDDVAVDAELGIDR